MHTHAANPYDPQPTAIDNHEYTLRNNAIVSGSQTPDLGFVLLPLYDAILPHLNWHLYMAFGNMMVRPASMRRCPFESASDACCPRNRSGCDCISYRFVLDSHINPPPLHFGGDPRGKHFMQVLERTFTRHAQS